MTTRKRRKKGTGTVEKARGGRFRPRYTPADGIRRSFETYDTYEEAERILDAVRAELAGGKLVSPGSVTLRGYGPLIMDRRERDGYRAVGSERNLWKTYVDVWACADWPLRSVAKGDVKRWLAGLKSATPGHRLATQTKRNALQILRTVFAAALDDEAIEANPCEGLKVRDHGSTEAPSTYLTRQELDALLIHSLEDEAIVTYAAMAGPRQGELRSQKLSDVHLDAPQPHVLVRYGRPTSPTKGGKVRKVYLVPRALASLKAWIEKLPTFCPKNDRGLLFPTAGGDVRQRGRMVRPQDWADYLKAAKVTRRVRWHDLRHTCGTLLLEGELGTAPWSLEAVKEQLGHSSVRVTERYAKATGKRAAQAAGLVLIPANDKPALAHKPEEPIETSLENERRGWDSNPRMTVLQSRRVPMGGAGLGIVAGLGLALERRTEEYLAAVARQDPTAHGAGARLAEEAFRAVDALRYLDALPSQDDVAEG